MVFSLILSWIFTYEHIISIFAYITHCYIIYVWSIFAYIKSVWSTRLLGYKQNRDNWNADKIQPIKFGIWINWSLIRQPYANHWQDTIKEANITGNGKLSVFLILKTWVCNKFQHYYLHVYISICNIFFINYFLLYVYKCKNI